jgi:hypothetical protein
MIEGVELGSAKRLGRRRASASDQALLALT